MIEIDHPKPVASAERLRAVVLDWAGTTVDFGSRAPISAILAAFESAGVPITEREARHPMGRAKRDHLRQLFDTPAIAARWAEAHGSDPTEADLDRLYDGFLGLQAECVVEHSGVIDGCPAAVAACRELGLNVGSSTGYPRNLLERVAERAAEEGYRPDVMLSADDVQPGRPAPWLCFENARRLGVFPMSAVLKVDDTPAGVMAGRNAGCWTIGVVASGNEVGLSPEKLAATPEAVREELLAAARQRLSDAGAHFLIDTIVELPGVVDRINQRLSAGDRPEADSESVPG